MHGTKVSAHETRVEAMFALFRTVEQRFLLARGGCGSRRDGSVFSEATPPVPRGPRTPRARGSPGMNCCPGRAASAAREELRLVEIRLVFQKTRGGPRLAVAQVERFRPPWAARLAGEDVDIVAFGRDISAAPRSLPPWPAGRAATRLARSASLRRPLHAQAKAARQVGVPALQKQFHVPRRWRRHRPWSGLRRRSQAAVECDIAGTAWDGSA